MLAGMAKRLNLWPSALARAISSCVAGRCPLPLTRDRFRQRGERCPTGPARRVWRGHLAAAGSCFLARPEFTNLRHQVAALVWFCEEVGTSDEESFHSVSNALTCRIKDVQIGANRNSLLGQVNSGMYCPRGFVQREADIYEKNVY
jgi:hypothetical protein